MGIALKFPTTLQERIAFGPAIVRFPGTWDEYWELAESAEYNVEFQNNEILAMSYESDPHSRIAASVLRILGNLFLHDDQVVVLVAQRVLDAVAEHDPSKRQRCCFGDAVAGGVVEVVEYHASGSGHYYMTADPEEIAMLDGGGF